MQKTNSGAIETGFARVTTPEEEAMTFRNSWFFEKDRADRLHAQLVDTQRQLEEAQKRDESAQAVLARIRKVRDDYASQARFADVEQASYFREFIRRLDKAAEAKLAALTTEAARPLKMLVDNRWLKEAIAESSDEDFTTGAFPHTTIEAAGRVTEDILGRLFGEMPNGKARVIDLCFTSFMRAHAKNEEDGGPTDWFNDTKPAIDKLVAEMKADVAASLAALPHMPAGRVVPDVEAAGRWQPIDTAPKDGTRILLLGLPNEAQGVLPQIATGYWRKFSGSRYPGAWCWVHSVGPSFKITHWTPIPSLPPAPSEKGGR